MPQFLKNRVVQVVLGLVVVAIVVTGAVFAFGPKKETAAQPAEAPSFETSAPEPAPSTVAPTTPPMSPAAASPSASKPAVESCTNTDEEIKNPKKLTVERTGVDSPMITVGKDQDGNPGAPPKNAANTTAWYNGSPDVGSNRGNVILTIHTYHVGGALGNQLYEGGKSLKEGDVIKISDGAGKQVCYQYTKNTKVWVKTYDPASGVFHNPEGPAQLAIMICWDYDKSRDDWDSRIIFYAPKMPKAA